MRKITVNGEEVEYFHIIEHHDGTTEVTFSKKFNVVDAHMSEIMRRVRENNLECQVFKDIQKDIVIIMLYDINDLHGILHSLSVPPGTYEVMYEDCLIVIDIPKIREALQEKNTVVDGVKNVA